MRHEKIAHGFEFLKKNANVVIALSFTVLGLCLRYKGLANRDLWCDEIFQLSFADGPFRAVWQRVSTGDGTCFPGEYLITYPFVKIFGGGKWFINIPHYIATLFGFYFMYLICRKYLKTHLGFAVAFLVLCFNGNLVYHSFEFRPYAVLPTLSLGALYFSGLIVSEGRGISLLKRAFIGLFFAFTVIYHAYGILIVGLCMIYAVLSAGCERPYADILKGIAPFLLPTGLLCIFLFIWYSWGVTSGINKASCEATGMSTFQYYPNPLCDVSRFFRQVFANLMAHKQYGQKHLALGIWISFFLPTMARFRQIGFFLVLIILPIELLLLTDLFSGYWFLDRQFVWIMSLYAFFLGWCWDTIYLFVRDLLHRKRCIA